MGLNYFTEDKRSDGHEFESRGRGSRDGRGACSRLSRNGKRSLPENVAVESSVLIS